MNPLPHGAARAVTRSARKAPLFALPALAALAAILFAAAPSFAAPEAKILRIDPRTSTVDGSPVLTTVIDLVQNKRMSDATRPCAALNGDAFYDCVANAVEQPNALYSSFDFPEKNAVLTVVVDGSDTVARFESKARWGESTSQPGVGTAWLILIDAASSMGTRFDEAKSVATAFVNAMGPNDIVDVMFFNDKSVVEDSKWVNNKQTALQTISSVKNTFPTQGRTRPLFNIIKTAATDGFKELGNVGTNVVVPMHQAMVVLSNGAAGADPSSNSAASNLLKDYLTKGRFPENNEVLPKTPVPVISVWFPSKLVEEFAANSREFMEGLSNPEIGGFYSILRDRQESRAVNIVNAVRSRFNKMHIVKWRVSCVALSLTQTFRLAFLNTDPLIAGDATFQNVPVGIDPSQWPLDIDREATERAAQQDPVHPGGTVKVFGNFCWGGNTQRAELYMVPKNQPAPASLQGGSIDDAKKAQRTLIEQGMRGKATTAGESMVEFEAPNTDKFLAGKGDQMTARLVVYDNQAKRTSAITADKIITVKAKEAPLPYLLIGAITFGGVVLVLLVVSIFRSGGNKRRTGNAPTTAPRPGGGSPPMAGGYAPAVPMGGGMPGMGGPDFGGGYGPPPMGGGPVGGAANRAVLSGSLGIFTFNPGTEMRVGRDAATCQIVVNEPRVSGSHAVVKFENGQLFVRDENSNNGTSINGNRIPPLVWTPVSPGAMLRFGPIEFNVRFE
ncbi:FHA domain-containing protein [Polyangium fumosum]|uniref:FHA domain-containing protein n=1 Tax=Polyangium fumosum TaxID=889272 RepID=A0A4V5PMV7_9BACT|nr:FHA domain-containing protein [Polyangium fumosum]TKD07505.1 FHA domain-containing protein [Polyangium fumosum]